MRQVLKEDPTSTILKLQEELEERNSELLALVEACTLINSTLDVQKLVDLIMAMAKKVLDAEASSLMLIDEATGELVFEVAHGEVKEKIKTIRIPPGKGIAGWVALHGEPLLIPDVSSDERFYGKADEKTSFVTRSIICAPLITKEKTLGIVEVLNKRPRENRSANFTENDLKLLVALASQSAVALDNAILYEKISAEKKKIETIVNSMRDGVVVTDRNFEVVLTNPAARSLFPAEAVIAEPSAGISRPGADGPYGKSHHNRKLSIILDEIRQVPMDSCQDIVLMKPEEAIISNGVTMMMDHNGAIDGAILAMRNVTGSKERDRVISEFLAITSNTMSDEMARFRPILEGVGQQIPRNAWRHLSEIRAGILKLLYFMELEAGPIRLDRTQTDFAMVIEDALRHRSDAAGYRNIALRTTRSCGDFLASVDRERILHVISRTLKNSIELSPEGSMVEVSLGSNTDSFVIKVSDSSTVEPVECLKLNLPRGEMPYDTLLSGGNLPRSPLEAAFFRHVMDAHGGTFTIDCGNSGSGCLVSIGIPKFNLM